MSIAAPDGFFGMDVSGENNPNFGKRWNVIQKEKMSKSRKGKNLSDAHKRKMSESRKGDKHWNYGKQHSEETKSKIGSKSKGRKSPKKGKNNEEYYGVDRAKEINKKNSEWHKQSNIEKFGLEKANEISKKVSKQFGGKNNPKAKKWKIISPDGIMYFVEGNLQSLLDDLGLPMTAMKHSFRQNSIVESGKAKGWKLEEVLLP